MGDIYTREKRSEVMARVRARDTRPEILVRKALHSLGYRFRLHRADLPGRPDVLLPRHRVAIFVHGCFWHQHDCPRGTLPKNNAEFWRAKLARNIERDAENRTALAALGWRVVTVWECETKKGTEGLRACLKELLNDPPTGGFTPL